MLRIAIVALALACAGIFGSLAQADETSGHAR